MIREIELGHVKAAVMLLNNFTDADWFQLACSSCDALCFPRGRISFENASGKIDRPLNGQVFFYAWVLYEGGSCECLSRERCVKLNDRCARIWERW